MLDLLHGVAGTGSGGLFPRAGIPDDPVADPPSSPSAARREAAPGAQAGAPAGTADLPARLHALLARVEAGQGSAAELARSVEEARRVAADLGELELRGLVRRTFGGRYVRAA